MRREDTWIRKKKKIQLLVNSLKAQARYLCNSLSDGILLRAELGNKPSKALSTAGE